MDHSRSVQIICADANLARRYRSELERSGDKHPLHLASSAAEARAHARRMEPAVALLDESAVAGGTGGPTLESTVGRLTESAPVVVVASPERQSELGFLITAGAADFVARSGNFVAIATGLVERRMRLADCAAGLAFLSEHSGADFGEILRDEVNNPLTGILGNAELLLARRDGLTPIAIERLQTITELAVRLRETVRRLSHDWEAGRETARSV
jgi:signal transduction histidine kinase